MRSRTAHRSLNHRLPFHAFAGIEIDYELVGMLKILDSCVPEMEFDRANRDDAEQAVETVQPTASSNQFSPAGGRSRSVRSHGSMKPGNSAQRAPATRAAAGECGERNAMAHMEINKSAC
jgi:hypothetical protein